MLFRSDENANDFSIRTVGTEKYDIVKAESHSGNDGGLTKIEQTTIGGIIWNDENYNGVHEETENGIKDVEVKLHRYYYDGEWKLDESYEPQIAATDENGKYEFTKLETSAEVDGQTYLAGYKLEAVDLTEGCAVTKYHADKDKTKDSDLEPGTLKLTEDDEYIIIAVKADENANEFSIRTVDGTKYDIVKAESHSGNDGGLTEIQQTTVSGIIWNDKNYNGSQDEDEKGACRA